MVWLIIAVVVFVCALLLVARLYSSKCKGKENTGDISGEAGGDAGQEDADE